MKFVPPPRNARRGKGLLPGNPKQWTNETNGLDLRRELDVTLDASLPHQQAFDLLGDVSIYPLGDLPAEMKQVARIRSGGRTWSGMAVEFPDGVVVAYNDAHSFERNRATLMEEFFHLWLGHPPSKIRFLTDGARRTHDDSVESEAYGSGAAALVPYLPLRTLLLDGEAPATIAERFEVSEELVIFRAKVTKLYCYLRSGGQRVQSKRRSTRR